MKVHVTRKQVWLVFGVCVLLSAAACTYYLGREFESLMDAAAAYSLGMLMTAAGYWLLWLTLMCRNGSIYGQRNDRQSNIVMWFCLIGFITILTAGTFAGINELLQRLTIGIDVAMDTTASFASIVTMLIFGIPVGLWFNYFYPEPATQPCQCDA